MATELQKRAFEIKLEKVKGNKPVKIGAVMIEAGYSKKTAEKPKDLTESKGWQELLNEINDAGLLKKLIKIAMDESDKRACLEAIDKLLKLKDRYPAGKFKFGAYEERDKITE